MNANNVKQVAVPNTVVPASQTNAVASNAFSVTAGGAKSMKIDIICGSVTVAAAVSVKLQDTSGYNIWNDLKSTTISASTDQVFTASSTTSIITCAGHGYTEGQAVCVNGPGLPAPLSEGSIYFVKLIDANTFYLTAVPGSSFIQLTSNGALGQEVTAVAAYTQKYLTAVAGDQTYLPIRSVGRFVATTGAGDSLQILAINVMQED